METPKIEPAITIAFEAYRRQERQAGRRFTSPCRQTSILGGDVVEVRDRNENTLGRFRVREDEGGRLQAEKINHG